MPTLPELCVPSSLQLLELRKTITSSALKSASELGLALEFLRCARVWLGLPGRGVLPNRAEERPVGVPAQRMLWFSVQNVRKILRGNMLVA